MPFVKDKATDIGSAASSDSSGESSSLDFELAGGSASGSSSSVDLSSLPDYAGGTDSVGVPSPANDDTLSHESSDGKLYEVADDGYAYELDATTLQRVGPPLDPVTHETITSTSTQNNGAPAVIPQPESKPEPVVPDTTTESKTDLTSQAPTAENKYPNTGLFMEDD